MIAKDRKVSDIEVERAKLQSEIKILKSEQDKIISKVEETDKWEIERLQK